jgi:hypothetical protein
MQVIKLSNTAGQKADPSGWAKPVAASGAVLATTTLGENNTVTVVGGKRYLIVSNGVGVMWFSITGTIATPANCEWILPKNGRIGIEVPAGVTTLNFGGDTTNATAYMSTVDSGS